MEIHSHVPWFTAAEPLEIIRYPITASLLNIYCLAANVVSLFVPRSLPNNGSTGYNIFFIQSRCYIGRNKIKSIL
jgi:hypothetical protein